MKLSVLHMADDLIDNVQRYEKPLPRLDSVAKAVWAAISKRASAKKRCSRLCNAVRLISTSR